MKQKNLHQFYYHKKILVTGHTGFKGSWLSLLLKHLDAKVFGYALSPKPLSLCNVLNLESIIDDHHIGDIRNFQELQRYIKTINPEIIFHLAAQPLVRESYINPIDTYETNIMGTVHLLEAAKQAKALKSMVVITTDKCYDNKEWIWPYRENDPLGGYDPYSSSKACAELISSSYRQSFYDGDVINTARAGNIVGGGDFGKDRLIPHIVTSIQNNQPINLRYPHATRPWQYILDVLKGYLLLAQIPYNQKKKCGAYNFSLDATQNNQTVQHVTEIFLEYMHASLPVNTETSSLHEAKNLLLDISKARSILQWHSDYNLEQTLQSTAQWYEAYLNKQHMPSVTMSLLKSYIDQIDSA